MYLMIIYFEHNNSPETQVKCCTKYDALDNNQQFLRKISMNRNDELYLEIYGKLLKEF